MPPQLTIAETKENELVMQLFKSVAGKDEEVDWLELKEILDYYTRKEEPATLQKVDNVSAFPQQQQQTSNQSTFLQDLLALVCGALCKNTPLADIVPQPEERLFLTETKDKGFSKDTCRSMIAMLDTDRTGKLNFEEFKKLWTSIRNWKNVFKKYDKNQSGALSGFELREALSSAGYSLNNHTLNILMHRYGNKKGEIDFDDFIMCAVKLKIMIELFKTIAKNNENTAIFTLEDWIENTLYS